MNNSNLHRLFLLAGFSKNKNQLADTLKGQPSYVGEDIYIEMNDGLRSVKISQGYTNRTYIHSPDAVNVSIIHKLNGIVDTAFIPFAQFFICKKRGTDVAPAMYAFRNDIGTKYGGELFKELDPVHTSVQDFIKAIGNYINIMALPSKAE
jgi:hypothetical protein